jgi:hypothetical protein
MPDVPVGETGPRPCLQTGAPAGSAWRGAVLALLVTITPLGLACCIWPAGLLALRLPALALFGYVLYSLAVTAVPPLNRRRPPAALIRIGWTASAGALALWVASTLLCFEFPLSSAEAWSLRDSEIAHIVYSYSGSYRAFAGTRTLHVRFSPGFPLGLGGIARGDGLGFSSREVSWPVWPLAAATVLPTWLLSQLRRERLPRGCCTNCGYSLTGNTSGRCPECGQPREASENRTTS